MTKAQREKAERLMLKQMLDTHPEWLKVIDTMIDNPNQETVEKVRKVIEPQLQKAMIIGTQIGWQSAFIQAYEKVKDMQTAVEIKNCLRGEADAIRERMGLKSAFDENGNVIMESDEE